MKISTVREFRDNASTLLRSKDPILVTRRGRLAGVFFPRPESTLPFEFKRELFSALSSEIKRQIKKRGLAEDEILADFNPWFGSRWRSGRTRIVDSRLLANVRYRLRVSNSCSVK